MWLDQTEKNLETGVYVDPMHVPWLNRDGEEMFFTDVMKKINIYANAEILQKIAIDCNLLLDYGKRASEISRSTYLKQCREVIIKYSNFLSFHKAVLNKDKTWNPALTRHYYLKRKMEEFNNQRYSEKYGKKRK